MKLYIRGCAEDGAESENLIQYPRNKFDSLNRKEAHLIIANNSTAACFGRSRCGGLSKRTFITSN